MQGAIDADQNPTFFVKFEFLVSTQEIFTYFGFRSAPNLVVSKPHMAVVKGEEFRSYLKDFSWWITSTDGSVTTQKMLEFVNKRTHRNVAYKPTEETIKYVIGMFTAVCIGGVIIYKLLRRVWSHWLFLFIASMVQTSPIFRSSISCACRALYIACCITRSRRI
jgi:oligosaccharyltransferase complex subunit gamma